jgi:hypothetical protein
MEGIALMLFQGMPLPAIFVSQLIATFVWSVIFIFLALYRFQRTEL